MQVQARLNYVREESKYTGIHLETVDYDMLYERNSNESILLNDFNMKDDDDAERLNRLLMTVYKNDSIETIPSCECGHLKKQFNYNEICPYCKTRCLSPTDRQMLPILWAKVPDGVHGFISPAIWNVLNSKLKRSRVLILPWLVDPHYKAVNPRDGSTDEFFTDIVNDLGWRRSINHFIENFDELIEYLKQYPNFINVAAAERRKLWEFIELNKSKFFPKYLPIPNKALFVAEKTPMGTQLDKTIHSALDATRTITSLNETYIEPSLRVRENKTVKIVSQFGEFYKSFDRENLSQKPGIFRQQIYGARFDYSGRGVITPIIGLHKKDDLHLPWNMAVLIFKQHIASKLDKMGYTPSDIEKTIMLSVRRYSKLIDDIFKELIAQNGGRIKNIFQRNPTLKLGSAQQLDIVKVKTDTSDPTISLSPLVLAQYNAD